MKLGHRAFSHVPASVLAVLACGVPAHFVIAADGDPTVDAYRTRQQELLDSQTAILARADAEKRELLTEERTEVTALCAEFDRLGGEIELRERTAAQAAALNAPRGRQAEPDPINPEPAQPQATPRAANAAQRPADGVHRVPAQPRVANGMFGFRNFGEFARAVKSANPKFGGETDKRLLQNAAATTYGNESTGQDGGFLVPPDMRAEIMERVFGEDSLVSRTDRQRSSSNQITFPTDMTTPWGTSGIQAYWTGEGATKTQSKPAFENVTVKAHTLAALIPVTEELLEDAPALDGYLRRKAPEIIDFKVSDAILRGSGSGMPLGILNSPSLVTVGKESGQAADTIVAANVAKMYARMPARSRQSAVWVINPDAEAVLPLMTLGQMPVYLPPGGLSVSPYGLLMGRPVIPHQVMETLGDLGDIGFFDMNQYLTLTKTGGGRDSNGMRADVSIHLWFDQDLVAYRFTIRLGGQPWWSASITPRDGSNSISPFLILEAR